MYFEPHSKLTRAYVLERVEGYDVGVKKQLRSEVKFLFIMLSDQIITLCHHNKYENLDRNLPRNVLKFVQPAWTEMQLP